jgi:hypothetical protein
MRETIHFPIGHGFDRGYWLSRCKGFVIADADGGRIGAVVELHYRSRLDQPDELAVRAGRFWRRRLIYRVSAVETIVPRESRLVLAAGAAPITSGRHRDAAA